MTAYYVRVRWMEYTHGRWNSALDYKHVSKVYPEVWASGTLQAKELCLAKHKGGICVTVTDIWPLYPQPKRNSDE